MVHSLQVQDFVLFCSFLILRFAKYQFNMASSTVCVFSLADSRMDVWKKLLSSSYALYFWFLQHQMGTFIISIKHLFQSSCLYNPGGIVRKKIKVETIGWKCCHFFMKINLASIVFQWEGNIKKRIPTGRTGVCQWAVREKVMKKIGEQQEEKISAIRIRKIYEQTHRIVWVSTVVTI